MATSSSRPGGRIRRPLRLTPQVDSPEKPRRLRSRALRFECLEQRSLLAGDLSEMPVSDAPTADETAAIATETSPRAGFTVELTRPDGAPLTSLAVGDDFVVNVYVQDLRELPQGVFAAYVDVMWDETKAVSTGIVDYGDTYINARHVDITTPGLIDESGALAHLDPVGGGRLKVFGVSMQAIAPGALSFQADAADNAELRDVLFYSPIEESPLVPDEETFFGQATIVVAEALPAAAEAPATVAAPPATVLGPAPESAGGESPDAAAADPATDVEPAAAAEAAQDSPGEGAPAAVSDTAARLGLLIHAVNSTTWEGDGFAAKTLVAVDAPWTSADAEASPSLGRNVSKHAPAVVRDADADEESEGALDDDGSDAESEDA